jgi:hypothetical protein
VDYITGSSINGSKITDTHQFTGSIYTSGSIGINTNSPGQPLELYVADGSGIRLKNSGSADKRWDLALSGNDLRVNEVGVSAVISFKAGGTIGIGTATPISTQNGLDISSGGISLVLGADSGAATRTNATGKVARIASYPYTNANTPSAMMIAVNDGTDNSLWVGGGSGLLNAATNIIFYTTSSVNALVGVERMRIDSAGCVNIGGTAGYGKLDVCGQTNGVAANICRIGNVSGLNNGLIISKDASNYYTYNFGSGIQIGSQYSTTSGYVNETQTITALAASYFLLKSTGTSNGSSSTTFNLTGLPATDGTVIDVVLIVQKDATASGINTSGIFNINGTDPGISTVFASGTAAVTTIKTFRVGRFNGTWRIIGTVGSY